LLVTEDNKHLISDVDLKAWNVAIDEYDALNHEVKDRVAWFSQVGEFGASVARNGSASLWTLPGA